MMNKIDTRLGHQIPTELAKAMKEQAYKRFQLFRLLDKAFDEARNLNDQLNIAFSHIKKDQP